jgi:hypothetical protein
LNPIWYNAENFKNSSVKLQEFHEAYPIAPGLSVHLQKWIQAAAEDRDADDYPEDNGPALFFNRGLYCRRNAR